MSYAYAPSPLIHFDHLMVRRFSPCLLLSRRSLRKIHIPDQPCFQNVQHLISWFSPDATSNERHALRCLTSLTEYHGNRPKACGLDNDALATRSGMNRGGVPFIGFPLLSGDIGYYMYVNTLVAAEQTMPCSPNGAFNCGAR